MPILPARPLPSCNGRPSSEQPLLLGVLTENRIQERQVSNTHHSRIQTRPLLVSSNPQLQARYSNSTSLGLISAGKRILREGEGELARKLRGWWTEKRELITSETLPCDNDYKFVSFLTRYWDQPLFLQFDPFYDENTTDTMKLCNTIYTLHPLFFTPIKFKLLLCRLSSFHFPQLSSIRTFSETRLTRSITNVSKYTRNATKWNLTFYLSTISRLALFHRPKYRSLFAPICRSFHQSRYLSFSPSSCFVTSDCPVKLTPMSHLLGVYWNFVLSLSLFFFPLLLSLSQYFSSSPFFPSPSNLVESRGSISTRFQNSFISRSATRITDNVNDA